MSSTLYNKWHFLSTDLLDSLMLLKIVSNKKLIYLKNCIRDCLKIEIHKRLLSLNNKEI